MSPVPPRHVLARLTAFATEEAEGRPTSWHAAGRQNEAPGNTYAAPVNGDVAPDATVHPSAGTLPVAQPAVRDRVGAGGLVCLDGLEEDGVSGHWQLQEAKQRFSELIRRAEADGPQFVTRHGEEVAVVIDVAEYRRLRGGAVDFKEFLLEAPDLDLVEIDRSEASARTVELSADA
jgi:prevent-host-death family protein